MKVILLQDVPKVGRKNEIKEVSDGFARNFLFAKNLAKPATETVVKVIAEDRQKKERAKEAEMEQFRATAQKLKLLTLVFPVKMGEKGQKTGGLLAGSLLNNPTREPSGNDKRSQGFAEGGKRAFGSITSAKIHEALAKHGMAIDKEWIILEDSIKTKGEHTVKISLPQGISAEVKVVVEPEK